MNCKPGDLAMYVGPVHQVRGFIFRIVRADPRFGGAWIHSPLSPPGTPGLRDSAWDEHLRPIRDPGDDAVDETLLRIPSPSEPVT